MGTSSNNIGSIDLQNQQLAAALERKRLEAALQGQYYNNSPNSRDVSAGRQQMPPREASGGTDPNAARAAQEAADKTLAAQMAERARSAQQGSDNRKAEAANASDLEEQRKRNAASRALALFRATGQSGSVLATGTARTELT